MFHGLHMQISQLRMALCDESGSNPVMQQPRWWSNTYVDTATCFGELAHVRGEETGGSLGEDMAVYLANKPHWSASDTLHNASSLSNRDLAAFKHHASVDKTVSHEFTIQGKEAIRPSTTPAIPETNSDSSYRVQDLVSDAAQTQQHGTDPLPALPSYLISPRSRQNRLLMPPGRA